MVPPENLSMDGAWRPSLLPHPSTTKSRDLRYVRSIAEIHVQKTQAATGALCMLLREVLEFTAIVRKDRMQCCSAVRIEPCNMSPASKRDFPASAAYPEDLPLSCFAELQLPSTWSIARFQREGSVKLPSIGQCGAKLLHQDWLRSSSRNSGGLLGSPIKLTKVVPHNYGEGSAQHAVFSRALGALPRLCLACMEVRYTPSSNPKD
jgi:hypothetical protein